LEKKNSLINNPAVEIMSTEVAERVICENPEASNQDLILNWKTCMNTLKDLHRDLPCGDAAVIAMGAAKKIRDKKKHNFNKNPCIS